MKFIFIFGVLLMSACAHKLPVVIAHRGASGYLPEHSLPAVAAAHMMDVDYIEQDIVLSRDGVPVVLHDIHLESTTDVKSVFGRRARKDGRFYAADFSLAELKKLRLRERVGTDDSAVFSGRFPGGATSLQIPTLEEELILIQGMNKSRDRDIGIYVELKSPAFHYENKLDIIGKTLTVLNKYGYDSHDDKAYLQCFDPETLVRLRKISDLKLVQLVGLNGWGESKADYDRMMTAAGLDQVYTYADGIGPYLGFFLTEDGEAKNLDLVKMSVAAGKDVHPFTFRADQLPPGFGSMEDLVRFFHRKVGVTGLFTDHGDVALRALR